MYIGQVEFNQRLRVGFVVYGAMNRRDRRTVSADDVYFEINELENQLIPLLQRDSLKDLAQTALLGSRLFKDCRKAEDYIDHLK